MSELFIAISTDNSDNMWHTLLALNNPQLRLGNGVDKDGMETTESTVTRGEDDDVEASTMVSHVVGLAATA